MKTTVQVTIYGRVYDAILLAKHAGGAIDVQLPSGRVSGLALTKGA